MPDAILVRNVSKSYRLRHPNRPATLQEAVLSGLRHMRCGKRFWGLRDISFSVAPGRAVGLIGRNGAGKSTLLRLVGGVGTPNAGTIQTHGRIHGLFELGPGFHPELTGRENVFISGVVNGLTRREVAGRFDAIVAFAELEEFIDTPLRTYSNGMRMRLAFAVAVHCDPEILLIDEVLAVGDLAFQHKCQERMARFKAQGCTILLASHDAGMVRAFCDEAIWFSSGRIELQGPCGDVVDQYVREMAGESRRPTPRALPASHLSRGVELHARETCLASMEITSDS